MKKSADHLLSLINDVIDVTKIESGKAEITIGPLDLAELVREVAGSFAVAVSEKGLELSVTAPDSVSIESDRRRLRQILANLVSNAVKFTDRGRVEIVVASRDGGAEIAVRDTGIGIRREDLPRLFRPFSRIAVEGGPMEGTGLGLYLAGRTAELLGGRITVQSDYGTGSVFTVSVPTVVPREAP